MSILVPDTNHHEEWPGLSKGVIDEYVSGKCSFLTVIMPAALVNLDAAIVLDILQQKLGQDTLSQALDWQETIPSPVEDRATSSWIKSANMVGVNVRTIGHFWNVVKYALSLSKAQSAIHLLPIWEPGVVSSLYGMASWNINPAFFSQELSTVFPHLDTVEKQLKVVVNLLHALGKTVGMDVIPHTDRYAEIVLANPHFFEWLRRKDLDIVDHKADLHIEVMQAIHSFLVQNGSAIASLNVPGNWQYFYSPQFKEDQRLAVLFGEKADLAGRNHRREMLVDFLFHLGFEPVPATMAPPYRGLAVDPDPAAMTVDYMGREWRDYKITEPGSMSRVFGPLTRYKLYERKDNNEAWEIDFDSPRTFVWDYICTQYGKVAKEYHLDFMRGDMSHVQMRSAGVPLHADLYYDVHRAVKLSIQQNSPYFAYFGESFLTAPDYMGYGDEIEHLELSAADVTLGDLQSMVTGSATFLQNFSRYLDIHQTRQFSPCFTMMTADKDDPRFDKFYLARNYTRFFVGIFLGDMPSYMGLGFECRDKHPSPAPNEHYTKLYVFQITEGPKATQGPYIWGQNSTLFHQINRIKQFAEGISDGFQDQISLWLLRPDPTAGTPIIAWTQATTPRDLFVVNLGPGPIRTNIKVPLKLLKGKIQSAKLVFSTEEGNTQIFQDLARSQNWLAIPNLAAGEGQCYQLR